MLIFDPSDVPLHTAKLFKYAHEARPGNRFDLCADIWFGIFMISFFTLRLVLYPYVVWTAQFDTAAWKEDIRVKRTSSMTCLVLLDILLLLNAFWGYLILRVLYKLILTGHVSDEDRSSSEEDDETEQGDSDKKID